MKIIYFTNNLEGKDGWSRHSLGVIDYFRKEYEVVVLVDRVVPGVDVRQIPILREPNVYLGKPWLVFWDFFKVRRIINRITESSSERVIFHFLVEPYALFFPFFKRSFKSFLTLHGTYAFIPLDNLRTKFLAKMYYRRLDKIIAVSRFTKEFFLSEYPGLVTEDKIEVINNGINFKKQEVERGVDKIKRILFVGMIKKRKGIDHLLEAVVRLRNKFKDFQVDIIGKCDESSEYFKGLGKIIDDNNLEEIVKFRGKVSDEELDSYYRQADVFVMPSVNEGHNFEGFGIVYLEANMYGVPAIGSRESGASEAIIGGRNGFLVDPYNHELLAEKILTIITSDAIKSEDCREWAKKNDWSVKNKKLGEVYETLQEG